MRTMNVNIRERKRERERKKESRWNEEEKTQWVLWLLKQREIKGECNRALRGGQRQTSSLDTFGWIPNVPSRRTEQRKTLCILHFNIYKCSPYFAVRYGTIIIDQSIEKENKINKEKSWEWIAISAEMGFCIIHGDIWSWGKSTQI